MKNEIIQALMEGKTVQYNHYCAENGWHDFNPSNINENFYKYASLFVDEMPYIWRLKPENTMLYVRLALMRPAKDYCIIPVYTPEDELIKSKSIYFVKWLTAWTTFEIEDK